MNEKQFLSSVAPNCKACGNQVKPKMILINDMNASYFGPEIKCHNCDASAGVFWPDEFTKCITRWATENEKIDDEPRDGRCAWGEDDYEFATALMSSLFDACVQNEMGGIGGCKHFELQWFPKAHQQAIQEYLFGKHKGNSIAACLDAVLDRSFNVS